MKAVYQTPLEIVRLMAEALPLGEGTVLDICGGSEEFLLRAAAMKQKKSEEELLVFENWTGAEDTSDGRENLLVCGPTEKAAEYFKKKKGKKEKEKTFDAVLMNTPFGYTREENKGRVRLESQFLTQVTRRERRWAWWESPAAENPRWDGLFSAWNLPQPGRSFLREKILRLFPSGK